MILRRLGNKKKIAKELQAYFPPHKIYIEPFFGAGGMFFNKPKAKFNIVNDLDSDVFNLFMVTVNQLEELEAAFKIMPISSELLDYWKENKEEDPIRKALRFLFLSNLTWMGAGASMDVGTKSKSQTSDFFGSTHEALNEVKICNFSFEKFLNSIQFIKQEPNNCFIYCDPPYLGTDDNYSESFTEELSESLFNSLEESKCKYAISEFNHPFIIEQAEKRGLNIHVIGERQNLKNRRTEILITNYQNNQTKLFEL